MRQRSNCVRVSGSPWWMTLPITVREQSTGDPNAPLRARVLVNLILRCAHNEVGHRAQRVFQ